MLDPVIALFQVYFTILIYIFLASIFLIVIWTYLTNPFRHWTIIRSAFSSALIGKTLFLFKNEGLQVHTNVFWRTLGWIKSGMHILKNAIIAAPKAQASSVKEVIERIHRLRFNPDKPFLISGDHFSVFYPRNLGIFYFCLLDPRVALNEDDWVRREKKYLQSTAYALEAFSKANRLSTTVVPIGNKSVTLIDVFAYPSDTLYAVLHALTVMKSSKPFIQNYPFETKKMFELHTKDASEELIEQYGPALKKLYEGYRKYVFDTKTGFIRKNKKLSSALDTKIRSSAFFDNVIFWKTTKLASDLGIIEIDAQWLRDLKKRILDTFWNEEGGYFLDDLSEEGLENKWYSSDWVIILTTGFLNPLRQSELKYFEKLVSFVKQKELDKPFPLKVIGSLSKSKDHFMVRTFVSNYQDNAIWSNLGQQYLKVLTLLYAATGKSEYLDDAKQGVKTYEENILKYKGYPELYDKYGRMMRNFFYRSILQTSWVVDFEHTRALVNYYSKVKSG